VAGDLAGAEADLAHALKRTGQGTGDPRLLAGLIDLTASLRIHQRRFDEAFQLLDWVFAIHWELGESHEAGRALISKSNTAAYALDVDEAVRLLGQGLSLIEAGREPHLVLSVVHNLVFHLVDEGRHEEARRLLGESQPLYEAYGGRIDRLKARWFEGRIAAGLGDPPGAEEAFQEVRTGFGEAGLSYDMALVSLELAAVWLEQGRIGEIRELLDETIAVFRDRGVRREAIAALLMLREACERERATTALLRAVATELKRLESETVRQVGSAG
jgi:tetratricopeptide (TPR) repeat protein